MSLFAEDFTTTALLAKIENDILDEISTTSTPFNTDQVLALATDLLREECVPFLISLHEEYGVASSDTALVADQEAYDIPSDAMGSVLRDVTIVNDDGDEVSLAELSYDDVRGRTYQNNSSASGNNFFGYYLKNNKVHIIPAPTSATYSLRLSYYRRPEKLVAVSDAGQVQSYASGSTTMTLVNNAPSGFTTNKLYNVRKNTPHFEITGPLIFSDNITGTTFVIDGAPSIAPAPGDWVTIEGQTVIPELPVEAHPWLAQLTAIEILQARGDYESAIVIGQKAERRRSLLENLFSPRNKGEPKKLVSRYGLLNKVGSRRPYGGW